MENREQNVFRYMRPCNQSDGCNIGSKPQKSWRMADPTSDRLRRSELMRSTFMSCKHVESELHQNLLLLKFHVLENDHHTE